jgi:hypothetical protein
MSHGNTEISFKNDYGKKIYVAYMRLDHDCAADSGEPWRVKGWIGLDPGETEYRANDTGNQWFYYYAEAVDGAFWAGPYVVIVTSTKFQTCTGVGKTINWYKVGMRVLDTVQWSGVRFVP